MYSSKKTRFYVNWHSLSNRPTYNYTTEYGKHKINSTDVYIDLKETLQLHVMHWHPYTQRTQKQEHIAGDLDLLFNKITHKNISHPIQQCATLPTPVPLLSSTSVFLEHLLFFNNRKILNHLSAFVLNSRTWATSQNYFPKPLTFNLPNLWFELPQLWTMWVTSACTHYVSSPTFW